MPVRSAGTDRYETAVALATYIFPALQDKVYLATGHSFPDALAAAAPPAPTARRCSSPCPTTSPTT